MKDLVLQALTESSPGFFSGEELSRALGVSRTAIWKQVRLLRRQGYQVEGSTRLGYRLLARPDRLFPEAIEAGLRTRSLGRPMYHYPVLDSTNEEARRLADRGAQSGSVILAEKQTGGKGRLGRLWLSPAHKGVWLSVILRPTVTPASAPQLTLVAAIAAARALRSAGLAAVGIKWPNDILVNGRKICGILTEMKAEVDAIEYVVLGIGINANLEEGDFTAEIRPQATSLLLELGRKVDRVKLVQWLLCELEACYQQWQEGGFRALRREWVRFNVTLGRLVTITSPGEKFAGQAVDIAPDGALVVKEESGDRRRVISGDVTLQPQKEI